MSELRTETVEKKFDDLGFGTGSSGYPSILDELQNEFGKRTSGHTLRSPVLSGSDTDWVVQHQQENKYQLLLSLYPGIRDMTDEEEDEFNNLIEDYFDEENV